MIVEPQGSGFLPVRILVDSRIIRRCTESTVSIPLQAICCEPRLRIAIEFRWDFSTMQMRDQRDWSGIGRRRKWQAPHLIERISPVHALIYREELLQERRNQIVHIGDGCRGAFLCLYCNAGKARPLIVQVVAPYGGGGERGWQNLLPELLHGSGDAGGIHSLSSKCRQRVYITWNSVAHQRYLRGGHRSPGRETPLERQRSPYTGYGGKL